MQQSKVSAKHSEENSVFGEVSYYSTYSLFGGGSGKRVGAYLSLSGSGREVGSGGGGRLFEAGRL